jgi:hypothetical protein
MMSAKLVFLEHPSWVGDARIYQLDTPYQGHSHIAVTVHHVEYGQWQNGGVEVVGCDENAGIPGDAVVSVYQSYEIKPHEDVLADLGYEVTA